MQSLFAALHLYLAHTVDLVDGYYGAGVFLYLLYDLAARTYHRTDELLGNLNLYDARNLRFEFRSRLGYCLGELAEDVLPSGFAA